MNDNKSLAHTTWNCKYHIVFAPKYRRKIFYKEEKRGNRKNIKRTMWMERSNNNRSRGMSRSYTYAGGNTAKAERIELYGFSEREK